jgi:DNA polymerase III sliding clamp (beta) subunit (PCNA family)
MTSTISLPITDLRAAMLFAARYDVRYYLNGIYITLDGKGSGQIQATDGHRAIVIRLHDVPAEEFSAIIPADLVETLLKAKGVKKASYAFLDVPENTLGNRQAPFTLREPLYSGAGVSGQTVDGKFPDLARVVPKKTSGEIAQYNWRYLADCQEAADILKDSKKGDGVPAGVSFNGDNGPCLVHLTEDAFALVMPMRKGECPDIAPDWFWPVEAPVEQAVAA